MRSEVDVETTVFHRYFVADAIFRKRRCALGALDDDPVRRHPDGLLQQQSAVVVIADEQAQDPHVLAVQGGCAAVRIHRVDIDGMGGLRQHGAWSCGHRLLSG